jgi:hypothetical protein
MCRINAESCLYVCDSDAEQTSKKINRYVKNRGDTGDGATNHAEPYAAMFCASPANSDSANPSPRKFALGQPQGKSRAFLADRGLTRDCASASHARFASLRLPAGSHAQSSRHPKITGPHFRFFSRSFEGRCVPALLSRRYGVRTRMRTIQSFRMQNGDAHRQSAGDHKFVADSKGRCTQ